MITAEEIKIDEQSINRYIEYLKWADNLNRFVKDNFGKKVKTEMLCISPIIDELWKENDIIRKKVNEYCKRTSKVLKNGCYYKRITGSYCKEFELIHILCKSGEKHFNIEKIKVSKYSTSYSGFNCRVEAHLKELDTEMVKASITEYVNNFYNGLLTEITEDEWNHYKEFVLNNNKFELL